MVSGSTQQPIQSNIQIPTSGTVQQPGPSSPCTPPQTAAIVATSIQPTTQVFGVSATLVSTTPASVKIPQVSLPQLGPTVQTSIQMPVGQASTIATIATSQPQFTYQLY